MEAFLGRGPFFEEFEAILRKSILARYQGLPDANCPCKLLHLRSKAFDGDRTSVINGF
jgi:hypothetical protein